ncbi:unnamed protein product, partial [Enterobius vermicularis]|uniref:C-type lectin domain-containing protein n=1 Tax=Enterobius vermicularis TaxID=51028 RepID=A0A0N4UUD5_ENTVE
KQQATNCSHPHISAPEIPACYFEVEKNLNYSEISKICQQHGMHVTSVLSKKENDFLTTFLTRKYGDSFKHFLGLTEQGTWEDGSPISFINGSFEHPVGITMFGWENLSNGPYYGMCKRFSCD